MSSQFSFAKLRLKSKEADVGVKTLDNLSSITNSLTFNCSNLGCRSIETKDGTMYEVNLSFIVDEVEIEDE